MEVGGFAAAAALGRPFQPIGKGKTAGNPCLSATMRPSSRLIELSLQKIIMTKFTSLSIPLALLLSAALSPAAEPIPSAEVLFTQKSMDDLDSESYKAGPAPMDSPSENVVLSEGSAALPTGASVVSLDGTWQMAEGGEATTRLTGDWQDAIPAEVPGSVHTALKQAGKIPDPTFALNDAIAREKSFKTWWMKRTFPRPADLQGARLTFGGVAIKCTVWLNGQELGSHEGTFGGPEFEVAGHLQDQNTLIVKIEPAPHEEAKGQFGGFMNGTGANHGWTHTVTLLWLLFGQGEK